MIKTVHLDASDLEMFLGYLEAAIMREVWQSGDPVTVKSIRDRYGHNVTYSTIATTMNRLVAKGLLQRKKISHSFKFRPTIKTESEFIQQCVDQIQSKLTTEGYI